MGRTEAAIAAARRAVALDPLSSVSHYYLGQVLLLGRQNREAVAAYQDALALDPEDQYSYAHRGLAYIALGDFEGARASCESKPDYDESRRCLAITYDKLGRHADAEAMLAKFRASTGDAGAYGCATIYAQWGDSRKALECLETGMRVRDPDMENVKVSQLLDPLRKEPRFQAVMRELKFPD
jgi:tetratricopeptide (TPR) repeat protein